MSRRWDDRDAAQLTRAGLSLAEAERQIELLRSPPGAVRLLRPATVGDGILRLEGEAGGELEASWAAAAEAGRFSKFVPASGAATRMFAGIERLLAEGAPPLAELRKRRDRRDVTAAEICDLLERVAELPFAGRLRHRLAGEEVTGLARSDRYPRLLAAIVDRDGLDMAARPKGLIPFHRYGDEERTAFEEHLVEGRAYLRDAAGTSRFHFTVAEAHRAAFETAARGRSDVEIAFSSQRPSTDTLALDSDGRPARHDDGRLVLRPGGHGALLANLEESGGDLVFVKNIDNVVPESRQAEVVRWQRLLGGLLARLDVRAKRLLYGLEEGTSGLEAEVLAFCGEELGLRVESVAEARRLLDRPMRVCGMVPNAGEPGGGPFWVADPDAPGGASLQVVEAAQIDVDDSAQESILRASTHFNPVMLVTSLRNARGGRRPLGDFVDPSTAFVSEKASGGTRIRALEHPGLWNGAMALWTTLFVEVPIVTFAPVKVLTDLLRGAHRSA